MFNLINLQTNVDAISKKEVQEIFLAPILLKQVQVSALSTIQKQNIINIAQRLITLDNNLQQYRPSLCKRFFNWITLKSRKIQKLKIHLDDTLLAFLTLAFQFKDQDGNPPSFFSARRTSTIQQKLNITQKAQQIFTTLKSDQTRLKQLFPNSQPTELIEAAKEVDNVFKDTIKLLVIGENRAIPLWTHSTKEYFYQQIMNSRYLRESSQGAQGPGLYLSLCDESGGYGPITYVVCPFAIKETQGRHQSGYTNQSYDPFPRVSAAVRFPEGRLPINRQTIAYITISNNTKLKKTVEDKVKQKHLRIPVISRTASHMLRHCFGKAQEQTSPIPHKWISSFK